MNLPTKIASTVLILLLAACSSVPLSSSPPLEEKRLSASFSHDVLNLSAPIEVEFGGVDGIIGDSKEPCCGYEKIANQTWELPDGTFIEDGESDFTHRFDEEVLGTVTRTVTGVSGKTDSFSTTIFAGPELIYEVESTCEQVFVTLATISGGTQQGYYGSGRVYGASGLRSNTFLYVSAQNQCDYGSVTARIKKRGEVYRQETSYGAYVIATAKK